MHARFDTFSQFRCLSVIAFAILLIATPIANSLPVGSATESDSSIPQGPGVVSGVVVDASGEIVVGATVSLVSNPWPENDVNQAHWVLETESDDEGRFFLAGFERDRFTLFARLGDSVGRYLFSLHGNQAELIVVLRPGVYASGKVFDDAGRPASGARVEIAAFLANGRYVHETIGLYMSGSTHSERLEVGGVYATETDAGGQFSLGPLPNEAFELYTTSPGFAAHYSEPQSAGEKDIAIVLSEGGQLSAQTVRYDNGEPVRNARIVLQGESYKDVYIAESGDEGEIELINVRPGTYRVRADRDASEFVIADGGLFVGVGNESIDRVLIPLGSGGVVRGIVRNDKRVAPVLGAKIKAELKGREGDGDYNVVTDGFGRFEFNGLPPGRYDIVFWADSERSFFARKRRPVLVQSAGLLDNIDFVSHPAAIRGRVETVDGVGIVNAYVFGRASDDTVLQTTTRADGTFSLTGVPPRTNVKIDAKMGGRMGGVGFDSRRREHSGRRPDHGRRRTN